MIRVRSGYVDKRVSEWETVQLTVSKRCVVVAILSFWSSKTSRDYAVRNM